MKVAGTLSVSKSNVHRYSDTPLRHMVKRKTARSGYHKSAKHQCFAGFREFLRRADNPMRMLLINQVAIMNALINLDKGFGSTYQDDLACRATKTNELSYPDALRGSDV
jgi:hypothetical protein